MQLGTEKNYKKEMGSQSVTRAGGRRTGVRVSKDCTLSGRLDKSAAPCITKTRWSGNACLRSVKEGQDKKQAGNQTAEPHSLSWYRHPALHPSGNHSLASAFYTPSRPVDCAAQLPDVLVPTPAHPVPLPGRLLLRLLPPGDPPPLRIIHAPPPTCWPSSFLVVVHIFLGWIFSLWE